MYLKLTNINITNPRFLKTHAKDKNFISEGYFMDIKACYKELRRTMYFKFLLLYNINFLKIIINHRPESYEDFSKSIINEYFNMNELVIYNIFN